MRFVTFCGLAALAIGSIGGCGEMSDGTPDESVTEKTAALTTGVFTLHNFQTDYCLGVRAGTPTQGNNFVVWACDQSANQNFQQRALSFVPTPYVELVNFVGADRCLQLNTGPRGSPVYGSNGSPLVINLCYSSDDGIDAKYDEWKPISVGNDFRNHECYNFESESSPGRVIGVSGGKTDEGTSVILWDNFHDQFHHPDQIWCVY